MTDLLFYKYGELKMKLAVKTDLLRCILSYILLLTQSVSPKILCHSQWIESNVSSTCFKFFDYKKSFKEAKIFCQYFGAVLMIIKYCEQTKILSEELKFKNSTYWVGMRQRPSVSEFFWIDRTSSATTFLSWYVMAPQLPRSPLVCTYINEPGIMKGLWAEDSCKTQRGFVCELPAVRTCGAKQFGLRCSGRCSKECGGDGECDITNGNCLHGCLPGFIGDLCNVACGRGTYGQGCSRNCSLNCAGRYKYCNSTEGTCLMGCVRGFTGPLCDIVQEEPYDFSVLIVASLCGASTLAVLTISVLIWSREMVFKKQVKSPTGST